MRDFILGVLAVLILICLLSWASDAKASSGELKCGNLVDIHKELYKKFNEEPKSIGYLDESEDRIEILVNETDGTFTILLLRELPDGNIIGCFLFSGTHWKNIMTLRDKHRRL